MTRPPEVLKAAVHTDQNNSVETKNGISTSCHKVILIVMNDGKSLSKGEQRRRKRFIAFSRNLLIPSISANSGKF
jgi:hypothetical protein